MRVLFPTAGLINRVPVFKGASGKTYTLEKKPFAGGGEGQIYSVKGDNGIVAKIYHSHLCTKSRGKKLMVMLEAPPSAPFADYFTWPKAAVASTKAFYT
jgi:DNA-binding helix-hairpin-helix protein with protein kinase domain